MQTQNTITAKMLQECILAGANNIAKHSEYVNSLNVFPVPDGDTGTNMSLTAQAAAQAALNIEEPTIKLVCEAVSKGALRGARGNSGVILSQILKGFTKELSNLKEIKIFHLPEAFKKATQTAYNAVMKPKEGTILSVSRAISDKAEEIYDYANLSDFFKEIINAGQISLDNTPNQLPVLKEAGVVDSGGQGLIYFWEGFYMYLSGDANLTNLKDNLFIGKSKPISQKTSLDIKFKYCTEFIINLKNSNNIKKSENILREYLENLGDSLVIIGDEDIIKVHVHTNHPGLAFEKGLEFGDLTSMKVDNMEEEHNETLITESKKIELKDRGVIVVSSGSGIDSLFLDLNVDKIISGGQTMNPSTDDIVNAICEVNAKNIFVFPNNKNIILAAEQASKIIKDKNIIVIPTKTIIEGISCMINYSEFEEIDELINDFNEIRRNVKTIEITTATRDITINNIEVKTNDYIGISGGNIIVSNKDLETSVISAIMKNITDNTTIVTLYSGENIDIKTNETIINTLQEKYRNVEFEVYEGNQPIYQYFISIE